MKVLGFNRIHYYLRVEAALVSSTLKTVLEYRFNFIVQLLYAPAYALVLFLVLNSVYAKATTFGGFNKQEGILLFSVFNLLYTSSSILFMKGIRYFLWTGSRTGEADLVLTKPISSQFLLAFSKPEIQQSLLLFASGALFFKTLLTMPTSQTLVSIVGFLIMFVLGLVICYLSLSTYMTSGFLVSKASQVVELYDKVSDYSQYPVPVFPSSFQLILFSLVPTAFFGYLPTLFLLGRGEWKWIGMSLVCTVVFTFINKTAWKFALRRYSSASS